MNNNAKGTSRKSINNHMINVITVMNKCTTFLYIYLWQTAQYVPTEDHGFKWEYVDNNTKIKS